MSTPPAHRPATADAPYSVFLRRQMSRLQLSRYYRRLQLPPSSILSPPKAAHTQSSLHLVEGVGIGVNTNSGFGVSRVPELSRVVKQIGLPFYWGQTHNWQCPFCGHTLPCRLVRVFAIHLTPVLTDTIFPESFAIIVVAAQQALPNTTFPESSSDRHVLLLYSSNFQTAETEERSEISLTVEEYLYYWVR